MENDNGMLDVPVFAWQIPDAVTRYSQWLRNLTATGYIDGTFMDKPNILAWKNTTTGQYQVCEFMSATGKHAWSQSCGAISDEVAAAYNLGKKQVVNETRKVFVDNGGYILGEQNASMRMVHGVDPQVSRLLRDVEAQFEDPTIDYIYFELGDQKPQTNPHDLTSICSDIDIAVFMLVVREGMFLGCNGWSDVFDKPLGEPLGNATVTRGVWERNFQSGTSVKYDEKNNVANITWAS
jgi:hypothetical protein